MPVSRALGLFASAAVSAALTSIPASAEITLSQLVVEIAPGAGARDVEIYNDGDERAYVTIQPRRIIHPGQSDESSESPADPERLGLLVSPRKLVLEPHQRRLLRIADIGSDRSVERVYRITVKPEVGEVKSDKPGLKLLVGYDMLVIARAANPGTPNLVGERRGSQLVITNKGRSSVELDAGEQCRTAKSDCQKLGGKRLYAGASWSVPVPYATPVRFNVRDANGWISRQF